ncbi:tRNA (adenosine(37)-N6)-threonylcarbamoyltransferase complex dimerization subunit type 1 TsaB [Microlunatus flavus]|uniref:tRNA threonylcarbamoyl adenosine modification protein YeaZ n=1 Tax=Microlunatus flavus TaxID=1036181 RepID=A0A1H9MCJ1_9ACTN|nr:tRNA (adenosine(37)-N6)-threonylcarbamoyltransferase complex dimerization subunit type 1 TsaB [Microlunatus flavus]SER21301.1 tRNA threonylcarbamoyl adenosine modification protein YeaZ [Microlunatus flavus]
MPDPRPGGLTLALDTSTDVTVGLARGTEVLAAERVTDRVAHVEQLVPLVHRALASAGATLADVDHVVVGLGPGPFTGLRVGIVSAQVLAHVRGVALHGVCSLDPIALAHATAMSSASASEWNSAGGVGGRPPSGQGDFVVATDARRREVYWARYAADGTRLQGPEVSSPDDVARLPTVGPGADLYADRLEVVDGPRVLDPGLLAARGADLPDAGTEPLYLRRPDAAEPARRKSVLHLPPGQAVRR